MSNVLIIKLQLISGTINHIHTPVNVSGTSSVPEGSLTLVGSGLANSH